MWYTIKDGETLSILAGRYLGNVMLFTDIFNANRDILTDPNVVKAGQQIWIPVEGKPNPNASANASSSADSPYKANFPNSGSSMSLIENIKSMDKNKLLTYGGIGLAAIGLSLFLI